MLLLTVSLYFIDTHTYYAKYIHITHLDTNLGSESWRGKRIHNTNNASPTMQLPSSNLINSLPRTLIVCRNPIMYTYTISKHHFAELPAKMRQTKNIIEPKFQSVNIKHLSTYYITTTIAASL